jgi:tetratricopeptide (TPR) repeat protein
MTVPDSGMPPALVPAIWGNVPQRNKNFTGRVDILASLRQGAVSRITAVLPDPGQEDPLPQGVQGLGGVGKTAIAIEYAYRYRSDYDLVWWIRADQLASARAGLAALASRLGLETATAAGIDGAIAAVLDALRRGDPFRRWLLIFDNADQPEEIMDLIPRGPGDVLITSRNHRWDSVINTIPMDVFDRSESKEFLSKRVRKGLTEGEAALLAEQLGDLPLALEQAGAMLSETGMAVEEYLRLLEEHVSGIMAEGKSPDYPLSMTAAWALSVDALQRQLPQARELLRCCAFFGPEPIPREIFRQGTRPDSASVTEVLTDPILLAKAIRELGRFALVTLDGRSLSVHRLIQALLREEVPDEDRDTYRHQVHSILAAAVPTNPDDARSWPRFRDLLPHISSAPTELAKSRDPAVRKLALNTVRYLYQSGDYASCLTLAERFIDQWIADSGPRSGDVLQARRYLGNALRLLGRYEESYSLTEDTLYSARAALGETDSLTLSLRNSFGADLRASGDFAEARDLDEGTRGLLEMTYGPEDLRTLRLLSSLALDYGLTSDYAGAQTLYRRVFPEIGKLPDASPTDVLAAWLGLAWALRLRGQVGDALDVSQEALDYSQDPSGLGPEHIQTLRSANGFTIVCRRIPERREEALEIAKDSYELAGRLFGSQHPDTLAIAISLANLLRTLGPEYHAEALALAQSIAAQYPSVYGENHPYNYGCVGNLALISRVTNDPQGARRLDERALAGLDARLGRDHHFTLTVATNLASDLVSLGLFAEARDLGEDTLRRLTVLLGPDHPSTLGCAANLALDRTATGDEEGGTKLRDETLHRYRTTLGSGHPDMLVAEAQLRLDPDFDPPPI